MATFLLILVFIATIIFLANIIRRPSRYGRAYQRGKLIAEDHPNLGWREVTDVQNMHASQFPDDDSVNGFWAGYKGEEYKPEGYDPDQEEQTESWWQKANRK